MQSRILEMWQLGLMDFWESMFRQIPGQCLGNVKQIRTPKHVTRIPLSLKNLTGAFIVWGIGCLLALIVFLGELSFRYRKPM